MTTGFALRALCALTGATARVEAHDESDHREREQSDQSRGTGRNCRRGLDQVLVGAPGKLVLLPGLVCEPVRSLWLLLGWPLGKDRTPQIMVRELAGVRLSEPAAAAAARTGPVLDRNPRAYGPRDRLLASVKAATEVDRLVLKELRLDSVLAVVAQLTLEAICAAHEREQELPRLSRLRRR